MNARHEIVAGFKASWPVIVAAAPFGMLFGALAVKNGFTVPEAVLMSGTIYAGASQMVGINLFGENIAPWLIVFSIFAVNFRHILYSAVVGRQVGHWSFAQKAAGFFLLIDPQFAEAEKRVEAGGRLTFAWYVSVAIPIYVNWILVTWVGAVFGNMVSDPEKYGIDFLLPVYFLGLVMGFRRRANWLPVVLSSGIVSVIAYKLVGSPWHVSVGALAGVLVAAILAPVPGSGTAVGGS